MLNAATFDPTGRFTALAELYSRCRPSYPEAALDHIFEHCGLERGAVVVDVGSGTGISTRQFAHRDLRVIGIEPNGAMRKRAEAEPVAFGLPQPVYREGTAESTGMPDQSADIVMAAQSFHWFEADRALAEFTRILKPGGWIVLLWNERDETDPFTAAYGAVVRTAPDAAAVEGPRAHAGDALLRASQLRNHEKATFANYQELDEDGLVGRAFSASYAPREPKAAEAFASALKEVFRRFHSDSMVRVLYQTSIYYGQRPIEENL